MSEVTRSGCVAAKSIAIGPASVCARRLARAEPAASMTALTSSACSSSVGAAEPRSESPVPRRSKRMRRVNDDRRLSHPAIRGSSHRCSTCENAVGT